MTKFEYLKLSYSVVQLCKKTEEEHGSTVITDWKLEELGNEGWEMCGCKSDGTWSTYYFKREIPEKSEITVKYKDIVIEATIIKDFGSKAVILSQDRVSLAFKRGEEWEAFSPGFDLLEF